jgi:diadenosine tetraphosphate (Ap4A) HIT family hydrolase
MECPFCSLPQERVVARNQFAMVLRDAYPISPGHTLIVPSRHVASLFDVSPDERSALMDLLEKAKRQLDEECRPAGYNVGINDGPAAGQTVPHLHIHLIPRYEGDQPDPRGGVRWIFPDKAVYWPPREGGRGA